MRSSRFLMVMFALVMAASNLASAQTVADVYNFTGKNSSGNPSLVTPAQGRDGALYGSSYGPYGTFGSTFRVTTSGEGLTPFAFEGVDGSTPQGGVTLATDGNFYGTASSGGSASYGVLFKIAPDGAYTVLHEFAGGADGAEPLAAPVEGSDGNLYGTTYGGLNSGSTVYKYAPAGVFTTVYQFAGPQGQSVYGGLIEATNGNFYGTAQQGGANNCGTIFEINTAGIVVWYYSFPCGRGGSQPDSPPTQASDGNFYGTTDRGGDSAYPGYGIIYKLDQAGAVSVLCSMTGIGGNPLAGLTQATDGNLYGVSLGGGSYGRGTLFQITTSGNYKLLFSFPTQIGGIPDAALLQNTNGLLYGTTPDYGKFGYGSLYSLDMGLAPFAAFVRSSGAAGGTAQILGQGMTGSTGVTFNGVAATSFKVVNDTYMTAVVPTGATTGKVVVTTPSGPLTSNVNFRIIN